MNGHALILKTALPALVAVAIMLIAGCGGGDSQKSSGPIVPPYYELDGDKVVITQEDGSTLSPIQLSLNIISDATIRRTFDDVEVEISYGIDPRFQMYYVRYGDKQLQEKR